MASSIETNVRAMERLEEIQRNQHCQHAVWYLQDVRDLLLEKQALQERILTLKRSIREPHPN